MLNIGKYGIVLKQIERADLELVRNWRNDPQINQYLLTRSYISPEQQVKWFETLDSKKHQYFVMEWNNEKIGVVQVTHIDVVKKCGNPGIYFSQTKTENRWLAFMAMVALLDYCFEDLGLETLYAEVLKWNSRAVRYNSAFGYERVPDGGGEDYDLYVLNKDSYYKKVPGLKKLLERSN